MSFLTTDFGTHSTASGAALEDHAAEPVLVTPCQRHSAGHTVLDDSAFAGHATFAWHSSSVVLARREGGVLRYKTLRPTARFSGPCVPHGLKPADRITRSWDGAIFEVVAVRAEGRDGLTCDLVESTRQLH